MHIGAHSTAFAVEDQMRSCGHRDYPGVAKACPSFDVRSWCRAHGIDPK